MPSAATNPFRLETEAALAAARRKLREARSAPVEQRGPLLDEHERLLDRADELLSLGLAWAEARVAAIVTRLERMAAEEQARQSDIAGHLSALVERARRELGAGARIEAPPAVVTEPPAVVIAPPAATPPAPDRPPGPPAQPSAVDVNARDVSLDRLHPLMRARVESVLEDLRARGVPMKLFEGYRAPARQAFLFAKGRNERGEIVDRSKVVTFAKPWHSHHQYGLAVDMVIDQPGVNPWEDETEQTRTWWAAYHEIARSHYLEPLSFEKPHIQLPETRASLLLAGEYPAGGDETWERTLVAAISTWPGPEKPPFPAGRERPALAASPVDWRSLPKVDVAGWHNPFGGQLWRIDERGVYLQSVHGGTEPLRSAGTPQTCGRIIELYGPEIAEASLRHGVPPELLIMTIATETAMFRAEAFTGPSTFRWEPDFRVNATGDPQIDGREKGDYSAGPMQVVADTARWLNAIQGLGYSDETFKFFKTKPRSAPADLPLYRADVALDVGAAAIKQRMGQTGTNPVLVAAAYNHGSLEPASTNLWHLVVHGDHLDRAATWFGDACEVLRILGRT